jgi:hypothetical protein
MYSPLPEENPMDSGEGNKLSLELNLVKTRSAYSDISELIDRKRVLVGTSTEAMDAIVAFILDNTLTFEAAIRDEIFKDRIHALNSLSVDELYSFKYRLASNHGLDLINFIVSNTADNEYGIPDRSMEYNVINNLNSPFSFIKSATKYTLENKEFLTELYSKIFEDREFFKGELFMKYQNPFKFQLDILHKNEKALGVTPSPITNYLNSLLKYLGIDIYAITS